ncbi:MAG: alpha/beta family hydrolase [Bryobacteraceae bacterium]|jgi:alpha/beta superfamily hydrolase
MTRRIESHEIAGPAGRLEALLEEPHDREPWCSAVVCHPHPQFGGTLHNKVVYRLARGLRRAGLAVLRFNYRGVGRSQGEYGHLEGEIEDTRAALAWQRARYPTLPYALAGFSFGARVITRLGCETGGARFLLAAGFPTSMGAAEYLERCATPKIFVQSTHDQYGPRPALEAAFLRWAAPKRIVWIEAADHFFSGGLEALEEQVAAVAAEL